MPLLSYSSRVSALKSLMGRTFEMPGIFNDVRLYDSLLLLTFEVIHCWFLRFMYAYSVYSTALWLRNPYYTLFRNAIREMVDLTYRPRQILLTWMWLSILFGSFTSGPGEKVVDSNRHEWCRIHVYPRGIFRMPWRKSLQEKLPLMEDNHTQAFRWEDRILTMVPSRTFTHSQLPINAFCGKRTFCLNGSLTRLSPTVGMMLKNGPPQAERC